MDDDLYGTSTTENQFKTLSARKADREGHTAHTIADSLFWVTLWIYFLRCEVTQLKKARKLLMSLLCCRTGQSLCGFTMLADRGYGSNKFIEELNRKGLSAISVMPEHPLRYHTFVGWFFWLLVEKMSLWLTWRLPSCFWRCNWKR